MSNKKEHPIIFSTAMVQAILEGRKSMTRRICKRQPFSDEQYTNYEDGTFNINGPDFDSADILCPYGQAGDVIWVRESFYPSEKAGYIYKADKWVGDSNWKPSIHMPRSACRIFLKVENVRVERLQEISQEDAKAEGINSIGHRPASEGCKLHADNSLFKDCYVCAFKVLWNQINGTRASWESNPWVWVVEFSRINNYL